MKLILILALLLPTHAFATECKESVVLIKEGEIAKCTGFLFSPDAEKKASQAVDDLKYYQDLSKLLHDRNDLKDKELAIQDSRLRLYIESSQTLSQELIRRDNDGFWQKTIFFGLGIVVTGAAVLLAKQTIK